MTNRPATHPTANQRKLYRPTLVAAALVLAFAAATAQGQQFGGQQYGGQQFGHGHAGGGEYIVNEQVVSDTVTDPASSSSYADSSSYAGDMPVSDGEVIDGGIVGEGSAGSGGIGRSYGQPDLFYNYYTQGSHNTSNAQMYVSPLPVPKRVGHTYNTYQPFYPEEYLYWHKNRFHKYYDNGRGMNRTKALYYSPPVRQAVSNIYWNKLRIPR